MTATSAPPPLVARERVAVLVVLLALAAVGWAVFVGQARGADMADGMESMGPDLTMGGSWPLFAAMWVSMMSAMMFPAAAPMVLMYSRVRRGDPASVALFAAASISLWFVLGIAAYLASAGVETIASRSMWLAENWGRGGGVLLVLAGAYQLTPLKDFCLRRCRTPLSFVVQHWRDGRGGAVTMGLRHGVYCVGCCWLLFLILIPLGLMNAAAMAAVAAVVFAEKVLPWGKPAGVAVGVVLAVAGVAVVLDPDLLPTVA